MSAPAHRVTEIEGGRIMMQLTESLDDVVNDWDKFHAVRERVTDHLGRDAFQRPRRPEDPPLLRDFPDFPVGLPSERFPEVFRAEREETIRQHARADDDPPPDAIENLDDILKDPTRFCVWQIPAGKKKTQRVIVDTHRKEIMGFTDDALRDHYVNALLAAGAQFKKLA